MTPVNCAKHVLSLGYYRKSQLKSQFYSCNFGPAVETAIYSWDNGPTKNSPAHSWNSGPSIESPVTVLKTPVTQKWNSWPRVETLIQLLKLKYHSSSSDPTVKPNPTTKTSVSQLKLQSHNWTFSRIVESLVPRMTLQEPELKLPAPGYNSCPAVKT